MKRFLIGFFAAFSLVLLVAATTNRYSPVQYEWTTKLFTPKSVLASNISGSAVTVNGDGTLTIAGGSDKIAIQSGAGNLTTLTQATIQTSLTISNLTANRTALLNASKQLTNAPAGAAGQLWTSTGSDSDPGWSNAPASGVVGINLQSAIGTSVGGGSNFVFLVDTNLSASLTNAASNGGTNTVAISTAQGLNTNASPIFYNQTIKGTQQVANLQIQSNAAVGAFAVCIDVNGNFAWTNTLSVAQVNAGTLVVTNASQIPTNSANFNITTNDFALNTYYTNGAQRAAVSCTISLTNVLSTDFAKVALYIDQNGDGTWERTGQNVSIGGVALVADTEVLGSWGIQPSARFMFTNLSAGGASVSVVANSSEWVRQ